MSKKEICSWCIRCGFLTHMEVSQEEAVPPGARARLEYGVVGADDLDGDLGDRARGHGGVGGHALFSLAERGFADGAPGAGS